MDGVNHLRDVSARAVCSCVRLKRRFFLTVAILFLSDRRKTKAFLRNRIKIVSKPNSALFDDLDRLHSWCEEWKDERLYWNPVDYGNLSIIRIPCDKLWLPDIVLYNSADDYTSGYMRSKAMVYNDGKVFWSPPAKLRTACKIDITYFPFDDQSCMMKFGSWAYDGWQVNISKR
ncbi:putative nachr subunit [Paragonimus heterotremus]|uniref:Putative nachr subunit n=1 Tax=Paragonimus heterotremus TaxID=100268 RepID=A0A8J4SR50_9TREM|nr:putative nachr subunit [Paragonimus heterotremus]